MVFDSLFYYKNLFVIELLIAEFLFSFKLKKKDNFLFRFIVSSCSALIISFFTPILVNNAITSSLMFLFLFTITILLMKICYEEKWINIIFCAFISYTVQHLSYSFANLATSFLDANKSPMVDIYTSSLNDLITFDLYFILWFIIYIVSHVLIYLLIFIWFNKKTRNNYIKLKSKSMFLLSAIGILINIILNTFTIYSLDNKTFIVLDSIYNSLCCFLLLYIQFNLLYTNELEDELGFVKKMWHQEKEQYIMSKENIDTLNIKFHDIKHQIRKIGEDKRISVDVISELEKSVSIYDSVAKTGNEALDVILTEKALFCYKNNIILTYIIDGQKLSFMLDTDIYSLFGNALDNAIEAVMKIKEKEKRIIELKVHKVEEFLTISVKNSFSGIIKFDNEGLPITTKDNPLFHGYGVKSISLIVKKYDGNVSFLVKNELFNLNILLPIK